MPKRFRFVVRAIIAVLMLGWTVAVPVRAGAESTADELEQVRAELDQLDQVARDLAQAYADAYARSSELETRIAELNVRIEALVEQHRGALRASHRKAIELYEGQRPTTLGWLDDGSVIDAARRELLGGVVANRDVQALDRLEATAEDLATERQALRQARVDADAAATDAEQQAVAIDEKLREAQRLEDDLDERLANEQEAARKAAEEQRRAEQQQQRARDQVPDSGGDAPQNDPPPADNSEPGSAPEPEPVSGNQGVAICPIQGSLTFIDSWGDARPGGRSHQGVDLLSPSGTPNVAVTSGRIEQDYGDRQGNGIFLYGDNGTTYYYFHLSSYEGSPRQVSQGEIIGYVGSTGASGANHTHFEIHPGGGGAINPYPYVSNVC